MKTIFSHTFGCFLVILGCGLSGLISANPNPTPKESSTEFLAVDKSEAAEIARKTYGGKILSAEEISTSEGKSYRIKLLLDGGRIKIVTVDSESGQII